MADYTICFLASPFRLQAGGKEMTGNLSLQRESNPFKRSVLIKSRIAESRA